MAEQPRTTALQYLDNAMGELRALGFASEGGQPAPIVALLNQIADLDEDKVAAIARTLDQASHFNDVVRGEVASMTIGERYKEIAGAFDSIRDAAKSLVDQYADGKISTMERIGNVGMKMTRGDIAARFDKIRKVYLDVAGETRNQVERETRILEGKGLGNDFLRHTERTKLLVYLLDGDSPTVVEDLGTLDREIASYKNLSPKPRIIAVNKVDLPEVQARLPQIKRHLAKLGVPVIYISALTGQAVLELTGKATEMVEQAGRVEEVIAQPQIAIFRPKQRK